MIVSVIYKLLHRLIVNIGCLQLPSRSNRRWYLVDVDFQLNKVGVWIILVQGSFMVAHFSKQKGVCMSPLP